MQSWNHLIIFTTSVSIKQCIQQIVYFSCVYSNLQGKIVFVWCHCFIPGQQVNDTVNFHCVFLIIKFTEQLGITCIIWSCFDSHRFKLHVWATTLNIFLRFLEGATLKKWCLKKTQCHTFFCNKPQFYFWQRGVITCMYYFKGIFSYETSPERDNPDFI